jgi:hypothetical protein
MVLACCSCEAYSMNGVHIVNLYLKVIKWVVPSPKFFAQIELNWSRVKPVHAMGDSDISVSVSQETLA